MAYVPRFGHDLFFSYAHNDSSEWIRALEEGLRRQLSERHGLDVDIWKDEKKIRFGTVWPEEIQEAVQCSAVLLAVLSPSYRKSEWCARERKIFLESCAASGQLRVGSYHRFLKLIRLPWPDDAQKQFFPDLQEVRFFAVDQDEELEFTPGTNEFSAGVREVSRTIAALLRQMRRGCEAVFIAESAEDTLPERTALREELRVQGYDVRPEDPLDMGFADNLIKKEIEPAILSAHILGGTYDGFVEKQIDLANGLDKRLVFWLTREAENSQDARQRKLIEDLRLEQKQRGDWVLLCSRSSRAVIQDILGMLRPQRAAAPSKPDGDSARIYVLCDPTTPEDAGSAREIQTQIRAIEKMQVELPGNDSAGGAFREIHEKLLRECDGLLLYRKAAPERWLFQALPDLYYAERLVQRPPVLSKALLVNDVSVLDGFRGVPILPQSGHFAMADLEPFLAPLRRRTEHAHV